MNQLQIKRLVIKTQAKAKAVADRKSLADTKRFAVFEAIDEWRDWNTADDQSALPPVGARFMRYLYRWEFLCHGSFAVTITTGSKHAARPEHRFTLNAICDPHEALRSHRGVVHLEFIAECMVPAFVFTSPMAARKAYKYVLETATAI